MAVVSGLIFTIVVIAAPRYGVVSKIARQFALSVRIVQEDVLGVLYRVEEFGDAATASLKSGVIRRVLDTGSLTVHMALWRLLRNGRVVRAESVFRLTPKGREAARGLVRAHRLWETYLVKHLHLPADHVHTPAMRLEHITDLQMQQQLADRTGQPERDPQGKRIPQPPAE